MKQFEKWIAKRKKYCSKIAKPCYPFDYEKGWRAALKEVLEQISRTPDGSIVNWIEQELGDI